MNDGSFTWDSGADNITITDNASQNTTPRANGSVTTATPYGDLNLDTDQLDGQDTSLFIEPSGLELDGHFVTKVEYTHDGKRNLLALCCNQCGKTVPCGGIIDILPDEAGAIARMWMYGHYLDRACE